MTDLSAIYEISYKEQNIKKGIKIFSFNFNMALQIF